MATPNNPRSDSRKKVLYLLGAGATHAELDNSYPERKLDGSFWAKKSLLLAAVSKRVCADARSKDEIPDHIERMIADTGLSNIELFFSLLEENRIPSTAAVIQKLKRKLETDIVDRLAPRRNRFHLHKALFEYHTKVEQEELLGVISLNYDDIVDEAIEEVFGQLPNYCLTSSSMGGASLPLLKLHGGFALRYRKKTLPIVTPGVRKNYLTLPYSLDFDPENNGIREHFGFFRNVERALDIDGRLIGDIDIRDSSKGSNPFKIWLKAKTERMLGGSAIQKTRYIRRLHT
jgi:hypothetical protein